MQGASSTRDSVLGIGAESPSIVDFGYNNTSIYSMFVLILDSIYKLQHPQTESFQMHSVALILLLVLLPLRCLLEGFHMAVEGTVCKSC